jgi:hypothetical protein
VSTVERRKICCSTDTAEVFELLNSIQNRYLGLDHQIDKEDLIEVLLDIAPNRYQGIWTMERRSKGTDIALSDLEQVMNKIHRQVDCKKEFTL